MRRREFLRAGVVAGAGLALGPGFWRSLLAAAPAGGPSPWGPLTFVDFGGGHGLWIPPGFSARVVAQSMQPVADTGASWHPFPDGGCCYPTDDGGWILVSNSEVPLTPATGVPTRAVVDAGGPAIGTGGVGAACFDRDGRIVAAYRILDGTAVNCAGGATPWGTWLSCEEWDGGSVWECVPRGERAPVRLPAMGSFAHEAAAVEPTDDGTGARHVYLTEDESDGLLYRFTPADPHDLAKGGLLEAAVVDGTHVSWAPVPNPNPFAFDYQDDWIGRAGVRPDTPTRHQVTGATAFDGGEGCWFDEGHVYVTTKGDDRVWDLDVTAATIVPIYDGGGILTGVDNLIVHRDTHDVFVAQDHAELEVKVLRRDDAGAWSVSPVLRMEGAGHTRGAATPLFPPPIDTFGRSEVTGLAFSPDGTRLYCNSQRYDGFGITYEVRGPWNVRTDALSRGRIGRPTPTPPGRPPLPTPPSTGS